MHQTCNQATIKCFQEACVRPLTLTEEDISIELRIYLKTGAKDAQVQIRRFVEVTYKQMRRRF